MRLRNIIEGRTVTDADADPGHGAARNYAAGEQLDNLQIRHSELVKDLRELRSHYGDVLAHAIDVADRMDEELTSLASDLFPPPSKPRAD